MDHCATTIEPTTEDDMSRLLFDPNLYYVIKTKQTQKKEKILTVSLLVTQKRAKILTVFLLVIVDLFRRANRNYWSIRRCCTRTISNIAYSIQ